MERKILILTINLFRQSFTHPPIATIGLTEEEALEKYGENELKVYRSRFTPMYFALNDYRQNAK